MKYNNEHNSKCSFLEFLHKHKAMIWYFVLLIFVVLYVLCNDLLDMQIYPFTGKSIITIVFVIILLYPLFSEMDFLGIKVKRVVKHEVEKAVGDINT